MSFLNASRIPLSSKKRSYRRRRSFASPCRFTIDKRCVRPSSYKKIKRYHPPRRTNSRENVYLKRRGASGQRLDSKRFRSSGYWNAPIRSFRLVDKRPFPLSYRGSRSHVQAQQLRNPLVIDWEDPHVSFDSDEIAPFNDGVDFDDTFDEYFNLRYEDPEDQLDDALDALYTSVDAEQDLVGEDDDLEEDDPSVADAFGVSEARSSPLAGADDLNLDDNPPFYFDDDFGFAQFNYSVKRSDPPSDSLTASKRARLADS